MKTSIVALLFTLVAICAGHGTQQRLQPASYTDTLLNGLRRLTNRAHTQGVVNAIPNNACDLICPLGTACLLHLGVPRCVDINTQIATTVDASYNEPHSPLSVDRSGLIGSHAVSGKTNVPVTTVNTGYNEPHISLTNGQSVVDPTLKRKTNVPVTTVNTGYNEPRIYLTNGQSFVDPALNRKTTVPVAMFDAIGYNYNRPFLSSIKGYANLLRALALARRNVYSRLGSSYQSVGVNYGRNLGLGVADCGFLPPECRATSQHHDTALKFTFDYSLNQCVQVSVSSSCVPLNGPRVNMFNSQLECHRFCQ